MKKKFTFLIAAMALIFAMMTPREAWGQTRESYTITFKVGSGDGTAASTSTACSTIVSDGSDYLSGNLATATKVYYSGGSGLKLGTSSNAGTIKMNLSSDGQVTPTSIVVNAKLYNPSKATTLKVNGSATQNLAADFADYTFNITSEITYLELVTSKYAWIKSITVNYAGSSSTVAAPTFNPAGGEYVGEQTVELSAEEGCTIHYTLDGTTPTVESEEYEDAIQLTVPSTTTIKAIAVDGENNSSNVASATYTLKRSQYTPAQLLAEVEPDNQQYTVVFNNETITEFYFYNSQKRGFYIEAGEEDFLTYCSGTPTDWEVGGKVSGTVTGTWKTYNTLKEFCPTSYNDFSYTPPTQQLPTPTGLEVSNLSMTGATLSWNAVEHASSYTVYVTDANEYEETYRNITENSKVLNDLTAGTEYMWTVQAIGDEVTYLNSGIAEGEVFETPTTVLYNVIFETQQTGGTIEIDPIQAEAGEEVMAIATAADHYSFTQWNFDQEVEFSEGDITEEVISFIMPESDVTVTATFTEDAKYTVTYAGGGDDVEGEDPETVSYYENDEVTLEENPYTRTGYTFDVWEIKDANGEIIDYLYGNDQFDMPASDVTVTATWAEKAQYTVTYMSLGAQIGTEQVYDGDLCANVPEVTNTPTGWTFFGWTTGSANQTTTAPEPFNPTTNPVIEDITLNAVFTKTEGTGIGAWEETPLEDITSSDVFVITGTNANGTYSMSNDNGTSNAPTATSVTIVNGQITTEIAVSQKWNISGNATDGYVFYPDGITAKWLYCTNANNGVRVGTGDAKNMTITDGYLTCTGTESTRYIGIYNNADWRCYTSKTGTSNIKDQTFAYYKLNTGTTYYTTVAPASEYAIAIDESIEHGTVEVEGEITAAIAGTEITLIVTPEEHYSLAANSLTVTGASSATVEVTPIPGEVVKYTFVMPAEAVTITAQFTENQKFTVSCYSNGTLVSTEQVYAGEMQLTEPANVPNGFTYVGYATEEISGVAPSATYFSSYNVTGNVDLYAVFAIAEEGGTTSVTKDIIAEARLSASVTLNADNNPYQMGVLPITLTGIKGQSNFPALNYNSTNGTDLRFYKGTTCGVTFATTNNSTITKIEFKKNAETASTLGNAFSANVGTLSTNVWTGSAESVTISYSADATFKEQMYIINVTYSENSPSTYSNFCTTVKLIDKDETISKNATWEGNYTINGHIITIGRDAVLTVNGALGNTNPANLIIEDGGQLIVNNSGVQATVKKNIAEANTRDSKWSDWYTISSPLANSVEFANVENLIPTSVEETDYDLYRFDEANSIWVNSRVWQNNEPNTTIIANPNFKTIDKGLGYIYANEAGAELEFKGEINVADVENVNLTMTADKGKGFNLIGNPFMQNITLDNVTGVTLAGGFYILNGDNTWGTEPSFGTIAPLQGFLVQATTAGTATISKPTAAPSKGERSEQSTNIEMIVSNSIYRDNAFAMFGEGIGLNKVNHRNAEAPMLYVPQDGEKFAIAFMDENTTVFPLNFKAMTTGKYSISLKATDDINTLVLVDNMTGVETNMLLENSYTFNGSPADSEGRFTVKLSISHSNGQADNEHFVYQNGSELVVNGEGTLQIFDVLGRVVISEEVHGQTVYVGNLSEGAYIVRMTGNEIKTQKIIIR